MKQPAIVETDFPTSRLTTVGTGGPARWFARPGTVAELRDVLAWADAEGVEVAVIGLGSNLLVADEGYPGMVVRLAGDLARIERDGPRVVCGGGASLAAIVKRATGWGLSGIEFGSAIPGTAGGAVRMNAGAYGGEVRDILEEAVVVGPAGDRRGGPDALGMTYRRSNVAAGEVVAEAVLRLTPADPARIRTTVSDMQRRRREGQPAKVRTFGSVWKNPDGELTAGQLLERCGLKGFAVGGARISPVHANFIENRGGARSEDVLAVMREARRRARDRFGVELEHEVQMLGRLPELD
ncbi:MAG TPA: UDP-N-acetylmuramate dehydrogenase [Gaiellales bacterium]|nr:UDP-N-acetylmuramate dehydrogenase [Gaiellales bacterium]